VCMHCVQACFFFKNLEDHCIVGPWNKAGTWVVKACMLSICKGYIGSKPVQICVLQAWTVCTGPTWVPVGRLATDKPDSDPQLMTYRNFLDSFLYPYTFGVSDEVLAENIRRCVSNCILNLILQWHAMASSAPLYFTEVQSLPWLQQLMYSDGFCVISGAN
jgi:hypothetical protein